MSTYNFLTELLLDMIDIDESTISRDLALKDLNMASLDYVELQVMVKKHYGMEVPAELLTTGRLSTIGDIVDYIDSNKSVAA